MICSGARTEWAPLPHYRRSPWIFSQRNRWWMEARVRHSCSARITGVAASIIIQLQCTGISFPIRATARPLSAVCRISCCVVIWYPIICAITMRMWTVFIHFCMRCAAWIDRLAGAQCSAHFPCTSNVRPSPGETRREPNANALSSEICSGSTSYPGRGWSHQCKTTIMHSRYNARINSIFCSSWDGRMPFTLATDRKLLGIHCHRIVCGFKCVCV